MGISDTVHSKSNLAGTEGWMAPILKNNYYKYMDLEKKVYKI